jgi:hypothetical protein
MALVELSPAGTLVGPYKIGDRSRLPQPHKWSDKGHGWWCVQLGKSR